MALAWDYTQPSPPIEGFLVQRRTGTDPWQEVGRVGATLRTMTDATAPRDTPLCYRVLAYRGQEQSPPSNEVCLTIPAATQLPARTRPEGELPGAYATGHRLHEEGRSMAKLTITDAARVRRAADAARRGQELDGYLSRHATLWLGAAGGARKICRGRALETRLTIRE